MRKLIWVLALCLPVATAAAADVPADKSATNKCLTLKVGPKGLESMKYGGVELAVGPDYGPVAPWGAKLVRADGSGYDAVSTPSSQTCDGPTVTQTFPWGGIATTYGVKQSRLTMRVVVKNTTSDELRTQLRLATLQFPEKPTGRFIDPGMWGNGGTMKLGEFPVAVGGDSSPGVLGVVSTAACLHVCLVTADGGGGIGVPFPLSGQASDLRFPFVASLPAVKGGQTHQFEVSLRFAPPVATPTDFSFAPARDVLDDFAKRHPMTLRWDDHRPIGEIMLASSGVTGDAQKVNTRRWIVANGTNQTVDTTTPEGRARFQTLVLRWADASIKVLKDSGSQGMVTWDIEGEEHPGATYYGKPQLIGKLAPEMEEKVDLGVTEKGLATNLTMPLVDAYFRKFRDAGLRVGVCLRPQTLVFDAKGAPSQQDVDDQTAYKNLKAYLQYAKDRWGCTLYYVDSTCNAKGAFSPWVFDRLQQDFPDVLMMPENQTLRNYAVTAPFDSYMHHGVARTSPAVRDLWPNAFSVLMFGGDFSKRRAELVDGVRHGDILLFNAWYENQEMRDVMGIYKEAAAAARMLPPGTGDASSPLPVVNTLAAAPCGRPIR